MTIAIVLAVLAVFDGALAGFRAAAGRDGRIDKRAFFRRELARGAAWGLGVVAANAVVAAILVETTGDPERVWAELVLAGTTSAWVFGTFATATLAAIACWFAPVHEWRLLATVIVLGPLTLLRPAVIVAGLIAGAASTGEPRVWVIAACAAVSMLGLERVLGRPHAGHWRRIA